MKTLFPLLLILISTCGFAAPSGQGNPEEPGKPNIVLIVAEDMSSRVGAFGDLVANTPNIDALAREGVRYPNFFSAAGVCAPNRSALITGVYPISMGTHQMRTSHLDYEAVPPPEVKAFPELLRRAGYATVNVAKTDYQFGEPFTVWDLNVSGFNTPPDLAPWRKLPEGKPFMAMINLMSTHESRLATEDTQGKGEFGDWVEKLASEQEERVDPVTDPDNVVVPPYYPDTPEVRASIAQHYDNIHYMDGEVERILENLESDGLTGETIIIWTTDHGDGLPRAKRSIYDSGLQVPLAIRYPDGRGKGALNTELVSAVDLAPTILGLAGIEKPNFVQGRDFLSEGEERDYVYAARDRMDRVPDRQRAVRNGRYKYIRNYMADISYFRPLAFRDMFPVMQAWWAGHEAGSLTPMQDFYFRAPRPKEELYDTLVDPFEVNNLAGEKQHAERLERLRGQLDHWLERVGDWAEQPEEEMIEQMWPGGEQPETAAPEAEVSTTDDGKVMVTLESETTGASIGYRLPDSDTPGWLVYTGPVVVKSGRALEAKAIRYGYAESPVVQVSAEKP